MSSNFCSIFYLRKIAWMNSCDEKTRGIPMGITTEEMKELLAKTGRTIDRSGKVVPIAKIEDQPRPGPRFRHKYGAKPIVIDDIRFSSQAEGKRYQQLKILLDMGNIKWFIRQPSFDLPGGVRYVADFLIVWADGNVTVEDVKGMKTPEYKMKKKQVEAIYPITIKEIR